jgi:hypothetical protein
VRQIEPIESYSVLDHQVVVPTNDKYSLLDRQASIQTSENYSMLDRETIASPSNSYSVLDRQGVPSSDDCSHTNSFSTPFAQETYSHLQPQSSTYPSNSVLPKLPAASNDAPDQSVYEVLNRRATADALSRPTREDTLFAEQSKSHHYVNDQFVPTTTTARAYENQEAIDLQGKPPASHVHPYENQEVVLQHSPSGHGVAASPIAATQGSLPIVVHALLSRDDAELQLHHAWDQELLEGSGRLPYLVRSKDRLNGSYAVSVFLKNGSFVHHHVAVSREGLFSINGNPSLAMNLSEAVAEAVRMSTQAEVVAIGPDDFGSVSI